MKRNYILRLVICVLVLAVLNAIVGTMLGIDIQPMWKRVVYNMGQMLTGGVIVFFLMMNSLKRTIKEISNEKGSSSVLDVVQLPSRTSTVRDGNVDDVAADPQ